MKIFFDTEFTELSKKAELISLGMIDEEDNSFYAELTDYNYFNLNDWVKEHVLSNLIYLNSESFNKVKRVNNHVETVVKGNKKDVCKYITSWVKEYDLVELVTDVGHYDMVLFVDLFGTAFDLPSKIPPTYYDINQMIAGYYNINIQEAFNISREYFVFGDKEIEYENKHNALWDAFIIKKAWEKIKLEEKLNE